MPDRLTKIVTRAERSMVAFHRAALEAALALQFLNRLSDALFIAARIEAKRLGVAEVFWRK